MNAVPAVMSRSLELAASIGPLLLALVAARRQTAPESLEATVARSVEDAFRAFGRELEG